MSDEVRVTDPKTGGQKNAKPERFSLIPWEAVAYVARVYAFGSRKYSDHNWRRGFKWSLSFDALWRHVAAAQSGEWVDAESGEPHLAHAVFHCLTLITFAALGLGTDDRACTSEGSSICRTAEMAGAGTSANAGSTPAPPTNFRLVESSSLHCEAVIPSGAV